MNMSKMNTKDATNSKKEIASLRADLKQLRAYVDRAAKSSLDPIDLDALRVQLYEALSFERSNNFLFPSSDLCDQRVPTAQSFSAGTSGGADTFDPSSLQPITPSGSIGYCAAVSRAHTNRALCVTDPDQSSTYRYDKLSTKGTYVVGPNIGGKHYLYGIMDALLNIGGSNLDVSLLPLTFSSGVPLYGLQSDTVTGSTQRTTVRFQDPAMERMTGTFRLEGTTGSSGGFDLMETDTVTGATPAWGGGIGFSIEPDPLNYIDPTGRIVYVVTRFRETTTSGSYLGTCLPGFWRLIPTPIPLFASNSTISDAVVDGVFDKSVTLMSYAGPEIVKGGRGFALSLADNLPIAYSPDPYEGLTQIGTMQNRRGYIDISLGCSLSLVGNANDYACVGRGSQPAGAGYGIAVFVLPKSASNGDAIMEFKQEAAYSFHTISQSLTSQMTSSDPRSAALLRTFASMAPLIRCNKTGNKTIRDYIKKVVTKDNVQKVLAGGSQAVAVMGKIAEIAAALGLLV